MIGRKPVFRTSLTACLCMLATSVSAVDWGQGAGPQFDFTGPEAAFPDSWSVSLDENVLWKISLPETGQSAPTVVGGKIFLTTMRPVSLDATTGKGIVAYCFSAEDGSLLWNHEIPGSYPTKLSAPFGDASSPSPVSDGDKVWFLNPTGRLSCFEMDGKPVWSLPFTSVARTRPTLVDGMLILHRQVYLPNVDGKFEHSHGDAPRSSWTQLQAIEAATGEVLWTTDCGVNMGCVPLIQSLSNGSKVMVVGRGGGHNPPEGPEGISMISVATGKSLWTLELPNFMATQTYPVVNDHALVFHKGEHLWVDAKSGKIDRRVDFVRDVNVRRHVESGFETRTESLASSEPRSITQQSNLRVGDYHYFRSYTCNYLGRIHVNSGKVEYLELPIQVFREQGEPEQIIWSHSSGDMSTKGNKPQPIHSRSIRPNAVRNSRGLLVMGDKRSVGNGWGHICSPIPTAFGNRLIVPIMSGMVFVIQADAGELTEDAVLSINDLGPLGTAFTRCSVTSDGERAYAHTIRELIAIGE